MMFDIIYATDSSVDQTGRKPNNGSRTLRAPRGGVVVLNALSMLQGQPTLSTETVPMIIPHQDNGIYGTRVSNNTWYEQPSRDLGITEWYRLVGSEFVIGELRSEAENFDLDEPAQEGIMPRLERSPSMLRSGPTLATARVVPRNEINEDTLASATQFLRNVRVDDDIADDGEVLANLENLLQSYGNSLVDVLSMHLINETVRPSIAATILVLLGQTGHSATYAHRLNVLLEMLFSPKARVRDGAVAGLGYMMSKESIPALRTAADEEKNQHIRHDIESLLRLLTEM